MLRPFHNSTITAAMEHFTRSTGRRYIRSQSLNIIRIPLRKYRLSDAARSVDAERYISITSNDSILPSQWDPLKILVPITDAVLIVMAVIFILALGMVAFIVFMAIMKLYFKNDDDKNSIWADDLFWPN